MAEHDLAQWDTGRIEALIAAPSVLRGGRDGVRVVRADEELYHILPEEEEAAKTLCRALFAPYLITVLAVWEMEYYPTRKKIGGIAWDLTPMESGKSYPVPPTVQEKIARLAARGIRFDALILGEERPAPQTYVRPDPIVFGIVRIAPHKGVWCVVGKWDKPVAQEQANPEGSVTAKEQ